MVGLTALPATAASTPALTAFPDGATSLREVHGDWTVQCDTAAPGSNPAVNCAVSQSQQDPKSQQLVLAVAVTPAGESASGTMILPFGLSLADGLSLQVDDSKTPDRLSFRTCLPSGCLVTLNWQADALTALRHATRLSVGAVADGGQKVMFQVSLNGFSSALDRVAALTATSTATP